MNTATSGEEWIVEALGCIPERLADPTTLRALFAALVAELSLHPVGDTLWHQFPAPTATADGDTGALGGITGLLLLAESHLTVHTFPEHGSACLNLFCCTPRTAWPWESRLAELLGARRVEVRRMARDYAPLPPAERGA
jgi:S-adenosylmethionine decarboxylase